MRMIMTAALTSVFVVACLVPASAKLHAPLDLGSCVRRASHIVLVTEGDVVDGHVVVLESWKGNLSPGAIVTISELSFFRSPTAREFHCVPDEFLHCKEDDRQRYVTGSRMILFLQKVPRRSNVEQESTRGGLPKWAGIGPEFYGTGQGSVSESTIWIEADLSFVMWDVDVSGKGTLARYWLSEKEIRDKVIAVQRDNPGQ